jgi:hypothetical protein
MKVVGWMLLGAMISWLVAFVSCAIGSNIGHPSQCLCVTKKSQPTEPPQ